MMAIFVRPYIVCRYRAAIATVLKTQNPIPCDLLAWWPGGRVTTKAFLQQPCITASTAQRAALIAIFAAVKEAELILTSPVDS
jgi:hypothetical protein